MGNRLLGSFILIFEAFVYMSIVKIGMFCSNTTERVKEMFSSYW